MAVLTEGLYNPFPCPPRREDLEGRREPGTRTLRELLARLKALGSLYSPEYGPDEIEEMVLDFMERHGFDVEDARGVSPDFWFDKLCTIDSLAAAGAQMARRLGWEKDGKDE